MSDSDILTNSHNLIVLGSCIIDLTFRSKRLPLIGESLVASSVSSEVGGKASNQAIAMSRLGGTPWLITKLGCDVWARQAINLWRDEGVRTEFVVHHPVEMTGMGVVVVANDGQNCNISCLNSNRHITRQDVDAAEHLFSYAKIFSAHLNPPPETLSHALRLAKRHRLITILNASPVEEIKKSLFEFVDILVLNLVEASQLLEFDSNDELMIYWAARTLRSWGASTVIISLGDSGLIVVNDTIEQCVPAFHVSAVDTLGAGDALIAGLAVALSDGKSLLDSLIYGTAVAALAVTQRGSWQAMPSRTVVDSFLENH